MLRKRHPAVQLGVLRDLLHEGQGGRLALAIVSLVTGIIGLFSVGLFFFPQLAQFWR